MDNDDQRKKLGFGLMRLPLLADEKTVDLELVKKMVDEFMKDGFTYFDTAKPYLNQQSESVVKEALVKRYPRDRFTLTDKLTSDYWQNKEEIEPLFNLQLETCGVEYFDYYLVHALTKTRYEKCQKYQAFEVLEKLMSEGKIKHLGISFHDKPELLKQILDDYPSIEFVQIQFNYLDYSNPGIQSGDLYEVCMKYNKKILVMEPCKGGCLTAQLPLKAQEIFNNLHGGSYASYAIRYAASQPGVYMVLSGMSNLDQMKDNLSYMRDFKKLNLAELEAIAQVREVFKGLDLIGCTACHYCTAGCPQQILIPDLFACLNNDKLFGSNSGFYYDVLTTGHGKASECLGCGKCENSCPQHLPIRELLTEVAKKYEK